MLLGLSWEDVFVLSLSEELGGTTGMFFIIGLGYLVYLVKGSV